MRRLPYLTLLVFFFTIVSQNNNFAQSKVLDEEVFNQANQLFDQKNYDKAIQKYELILAGGFESEDVYFNLGNSYLQKKQYGKAILNYERGLIISPRNKSILQNLALANDKKADKIEKVPPFFLAQWWSQIRNLTQSGIWSLLAILFLWLGIGGLIGWILGKNRSQRKKGFTAGLISLGLSLVLFALAYSSYSVYQNSGAAIIMAPKTALKQLPDSISQEIIEIHEGTKAEILEKVTSWYKVRLENGEVGWVIETALEEI